MQVIRWLKCLCFWYPVKVRCCKYRDKFINYIDRVSACCHMIMCHGSEELSPDDFLCKWHDRVSVGLAILTICTQKQVGWRIFFHNSKFFPICFWSCLITRIVKALRWHISVGNHDILKRTMDQGSESDQSSRTQKSRFLNYWAQSWKKSHDRKIDICQLSRVGEPPKRPSVKFI